MSYVLAIALFVISIVLTEVMKPKTKIENAKPAGLGDFNFPTATEGRVRPIVFGRVALAAPNVGWYGNLQFDSILQKVKKGWVNADWVITGYRYYVGVQLGLCRGPATLRKFWVGETLFWSGTLSTESTASIQKNVVLVNGSPTGEGLSATLEFYPGTTTQNPSTYLGYFQAPVGQSQPRFTGDCYVVMRNFGGVPTSKEHAESIGGAYIGESTSVKPWKFEVERYPSIFSGQSAGQHRINTDDCNPMNVAYELFTNTEWGYGFPAADIDVGASSSFKTASDTMITENNGFSMVVDKATDKADLLKILEEQMDGVFYLDIRTGKWKVKLVREDYDIDLVPQFDDDSVSEVRDYTQGTWHATANQVHAEFTKRVDDYKLSFGFAQDPANMIMQGGGSVTAPKIVAVQKKYPGCMTVALANQLAWRDVRGLSRPRVRATFVTNRKFWQLTVAGVFAWTSTKFGFIKLPMRVLKIDYGTITDNKMTVTAVEDTYAAMNGSFANPPQTGWIPPSTTLVAYPAGDALAFEAPRAVVVRDDDYAGDPSVAMILAAVRRQTQEIAAQIGQRNAAGSPSGAYAVAGETGAFILIGKLQSALATGTAVPTSSITVLPDPDLQEGLEGVFNDATSLGEMGTGLVQLVMVDNEFMLVKAASVSGANVNLTTVYRGVLDSVQSDHAANARVYLLFLGAELANTIIANTNNVDVELRARSLDEVFAGAVTPIAFAMDKRALRPYPPSALFYNGGSIWNAPALEGDGSGLNGVGFDVEWRRRRYDTADELTELLADQAVDASTEYRIRVFVDPAGANVLAYDSGFVTGAGPVTPTQVAIVNEAAAGTLLRVNVQTRHDIGAETNLASRYEIDHRVMPTSARSAQFYLGGDKSANVATAVYTAVASGTFTVNIGGSNATGAVEYRINGGAWTAVIAAGLVTGTILGVVATDTIELRHTVNEAPARNFVELVNPSAAAVAYGVFTDGT